MTKAEKAAAAAAAKLKAENDLKEQSKALELANLTKEQFEALTEGEQEHLLHLAKAAIAEEQEAEQSTAGKLPDVPEEGLVRVRKGDEVIDVHHTCLKAHQDIGWVEVTE